MSEKVRYTVIALLVVLLIASISLEEYFIIFLIVMCVQGLQVWRKNKSDRGDKY